MDFINNVDSVHVDIFLMGGGAHSDDEIDRVKFRYAGRLYMVELFLGDCVATLYRRDAPVHGDPCFAWTWLGFATLDEHGKLASNSVLPPAPVPDVLAMAEQKLGYVELWT